MSQSILKILHHFRTFAYFRLLSQAKYTVITTISYNHVTLYNQFVGFHNIKKFVLNNSLHCFFFKFFQALNKNSIDSNVAFLIFSEKPFSIKIIVFCIWFIHEELTELISWLLPIVVLRSGDVSSIFQFFWYVEIVHNEEWISNTITGFIFCDRMYNLTLSDTDFMINRLINIILRKACSPYWCGMLLR